METHLLSLGYGIYGYTHKNKHTILDTLQYYENFSAAIK